MKTARWEWIASLIAGLGLGLLYAWGIAPVRYIDTVPNTLREDFKDKFRVAIAASYAATHDLERAKARLALLGDSDSIQTLTAQAQRMLAQGESFDSVQQVALLATDLRGGASSGPPSAPVASPTGAPAFTRTPEFPVQETITETVEAAETIVPLDTPTPRPTRTPIPTPASPFLLVSQDVICNPNLTDGLMQISVIDRRGRQMPGVGIVITWNGGEEHFFTGLKPEIAGGYADYIMQAGVTYSVGIAGSSAAPIPNLSAPSCPDIGGQTYPGGLHLTFQQP